MRLVIYRGVGSDLKMVSESELQFPKKGINKFLIKPLNVRTGDFLGLFLQNGGSVAYKLLDNSWERWAGNFSGKVMFTMQNTNSDNWFSSTERIYAVRAEVKDEVTPTNSNFAGNELKDYGKEDTFKNSFVVDTNNPVKEDGIIENFEVFARTGNPFRLAIYRGVGKDMKMVEESRLKFPNW